MARKKSLLNQIADFVESLGESPKTTRQHQPLIQVVQRLREGVVIDKYTYVAVSILLMALILGACQGAASPIVFQDAPVPPLPVIHLHHGGQVYDGKEGSRCWPAETGVSLCADEGPFPWKVLDTALPVPVATGDSITVEVEADGRPDSIQVAIYDATAEQASDAWRQVIELEPKLELPFRVDLPEGTYFIRISGRWAVGDVAYKFKLAVSSPSE
ncbi:MAG: hypothetical protein J4N73_08420 [Chloroflexi bacterium]|nr:hypothetical protein [Chloroflexota bacterium]